MEKEIKQKLVVKVLGKNGNIFNIIGICSSALKQAGMKDEAKEMTERAFQAEDYHKALAIMMEYCIFK